MREGVGKEKEKKKRKNGYTPTLLNSLPIESAGGE